MVEAALEMVAVDQVVVDGGEMEEGMGTGEVVVVVYYEEEGRRSWLKRMGRVGVGRLDVEEGVVVEKGVTICRRDISKAKAASDTNSSLRHRAGGWLWRDGALFERSAVAFDISKRQISDFDSRQTDSTTNFN